MTYNFNGNIAAQIAASTQYAYSYDANGNIATLNRVGTSPGAFTYSYTGNKLTSLKVNTTPYAYTYDANGNATKDGCRGMELQYNLLNLPRKVSKGTRLIEYT